MLRDRQAETVRTLVLTSCRVRREPLTKLLMIAVNLASQRAGFWTDGRECVLHLATAFRMAEAAHRSAEQAHG